MIFGGADGSARSASRNLARCAELSDQSMATFRIAAVDHHEAALGNDTPRDRFADAGRAASDEDDFVL